MCPALCQKGLASMPVNVYEFREGCIIPLEKKRNISSDENMLNEELEKTNELFRALLWAGKRD